MKDEVGREDRNPDFQNVFEGGLSSFGATGTDTVNYTKIKCINPHFEPSFSAF